ANTRFGALRAMETLLQLVQNGAENTSVPWVTIEDSPRFPWRGLLLDSARHFIPLADIKRQIDGMAAAKLNVLHWHLTDDQGWRF
ncbi:family 20 glycosylhydrolase, partial [Klebsiella pneumoniae]